MGTWKHNLLKTVIVENTLKKGFIDKFSEWREVFPQNKDNEI